MDHELAVATDKAQTAVALKNTAELEIGRIREETERKLSHMEEQLAAAGNQVQVEAAWRRATDLELARLRQDTARRPLLRGDQQAAGDQAAATAFNCTAAALQPQGDDGTPPATPLKRPTTRSVKSKKTTTAEAGRECRQEAAHEDRR